MLTGLRITVIASYIFLSVLAVYTPVTRKYGRSNALMNQTSYGYFRMVQSSLEVSRVPSIWMQDDSNKRLRIDVGKRGETGFIAEYYFLKNESYEVYPANDSHIKCKKIPDFNYTMEISTYAEPNFGFLGRHVLEEYNNITADLYAGQAVDAAGPMNCIFYCDPETCKQYLGMTVIGSANKFSFLEYWYGDNMTSTVPPASWFNLPPECSSPDVEYYFGHHNLDGTMKIDPETTTAATATTTQQQQTITTTQQQQTITTTQQQQITTIQQQPCTTQVINQNPVSFVVQRSKGWFQCC